MGVNVSEVFGQNVFDESVMKNRLPEATYNEIKKIMPNCIIERPTIEDIMLCNVKGGK